MNLYHINDCYVIVLIECYSSQMDEWNEWSMYLDANGEFRLMLGGGGWGQMSFHLYVVGLVK